MAEPEVRADEPRADDGAVPAGEIGGEPTSESTGEPERDSRGELADGPGAPVVADGVPLAAVTPVSLTSVLPTGAPNSLADVSSFSVGVADHVAAPLDEPRHW